MKQNPESPNPGSDEAIDAGCTCPVLDNHYGRGWHGQAGVFIYSGDCPIHGKPKRDQDGEPSEERSNEPIA